MNDSLPIKFNEDDIKNIKPFHAPHDKMCVVCTELIYKKKRVTYFPLMKDWVHLRCYIDSIFYLEPSLERIRRKRKSQEVFSQLSKERVLLKYLLESKGYFQGLSLDKNKRLNGL